MTTIDIAFSPALWMIAKATAVLAFANRAGRQPSPRIGGTAPPGIDAGPSGLSADRIRAANSRAGTRLPVDLLKSVAAGGLR
jgi:hypothetical protein